MPASLDILSTVTGSQAITKLEQQLGKIINLTTTMNEANRVAQLQNRVEITQLARRNQLLIAKTNLSDQEITTLAAQMNLNERLRFQVQNRLQVEQEALILRRQFTTEGIQLSLQEARVATMANQQIIASEKILEQQLRIKRRALMQVSISLFVMNISANQLVSSLKPLVKGNEEATNAINNFQVMLNLAIGPMQAYLALLQIQTALQIETAQTAMLMGSAMGAAFFIMLALTSKSGELRVVFGALAGVLAALTIKQFLSATATTIQAGSIATLRAVIGDPTGLIALVAGLAITGAAVGIIGGMIQSAQTITGQAKFVREPGIARLDPGEFLIRPGAGGLGLGGATINVILPPGARATEEEGLRFGKAFRRGAELGKTRRPGRSFASTGA